MISLKKKNESNEKLCTYYKNLQPVFHACESFHLLITFMEGLNNRQ